MKTQMLTYIITNHDRSARAVAELTRDSAYYCNGYKPEIIDPINISQAQFVFENLNIKLNKETPSITQNEILRFVSHFSLWERCVAINQNIIITEQDAFFTHDWEEIEFNGILKLNFGSYLLGYVIKPSMAEKLILHTLEHGCCDVANFVANAPIHNEKKIHPLLSKQNI
ncbi:hypothetical protein B9Z35_08180 [Limnohabitans sp. Jir61]|uniref:glycosyltransferase family 25 protein n=1 Tax=Limnohabitans sp. Jir61 TaxID=1826168 RepID=UPI000D3A9AC7|nr:glycosyltransferase family 25 protein [Limnohabitans sp. Jir61]PUE31004.1 hypothetical protein B9Z35_08180 [Limnohabitans sp. Jir61]